MTDNLFASARKRPVASNDLVLHETASGSRQHRSNLDIEVYSIRVYL